MKKYSTLIYVLLLSGIIVISAIDAMAQTESTPKKISLGFEAGYQVTNIYDSQAYSNLPKGKPGFNSGLFIEYPLTNILSARIGLSYDKRGFVSQDNKSPIGEVQSDDSVYVSYGSYFATDLSYSLSYLTIPISLLYTRGNEKFDLSLQITLYYSLLLNATVDGNTELYIYPDHAPNFETPEYQVPGSTFTYYDKQDVMQEFISNDWGVQLSLGLTYHINKRLGIFLSPGFTIAFQQLYADPLRNSKWNNIYKVNAGIKYKLK